MDSVLQTALGFTSNIWPLIVMLGVLVFVHELGHFVLAKWSGVKVLKFSIGFGPKIFGWKKRETEYVVSWIPLGGYVKMLGENPGEEIPPEDRDRTLTNKPLRQKLAIVFAGPGMNLVLPIFLFVGLYFIGYPDLVALVGSVEEDSVAAEAGIAPGDRIESINGMPVRWWDDVAAAIDEKVGSPLVLGLDGVRGRRELTVVPEEKEITTLLGDKEKVGDIGISPVYEPAIAAVSRFDSPAGKVGIRTGDEILSIGGMKLTRRQEIAPALRRARAPLDATIKRDGEEMRVRMETVPAASEIASLTDDKLLARFGFENPELFIKSVEKHSPASEGGLEPRDRLLSVDGDALESWESFTEAVLESEGTALALKIRREGAEQTLVIQPGLRFNRDPLAEESKTYYVGVSSLARFKPGLVEPRIERNPLKALILGVRETWRMCDLVLSGMVKLITGQIRLDNIGGPIQIGVVAAKAADEGLITFVRMMAFISINLGILNLLPIPILDGGHLLFFSIEAVKRSPISVRKKEMAQQVGLTMLLLLIGVAFYNDIARSWSQIVGFLKDVGTRLL